jgi:putative tricarboxylic transport membrane protein
MAQDKRTPSFLHALVGLGVVAIALGLAFGAVSIPSAAGYAGVGPNFLPWLVSGALFLCGGFMLYEARTGGFRHMEEGPPGDQAYWPGFVWMSAGLLANAALLTTIGFIFSCACALCWRRGACATRKARRRTASGPGSRTVSPDC